MYFHKVPRLAQLYYPKAIWSSEGLPHLKLTFDDGPHPESTPVILELLRNKGLKATFFCSGSQVAKHPELLHQIVDEGHKIGYHGYHHLNGWKTSTSEYIKDLTQNMEQFSATMFRPAYGKLSRSQYKAIGEQMNLQLVLWSHMPGDFDPKIDETTIIARISKVQKENSIIVLHDKPNCLSKVKAVLSIY